MIVKRKDLLIQTDKNLIYVSISKRYLLRSDNKFYIKESY